MHPSDRDPSDFARRWLEEQRRLWQGVHASPGAWDEAEAAWEAACEGWWRGVSEGVPAPLAAPLRAALEQTRVCLRLGRALAEGGGPAGLVSGVVSPQRLFTGAAEALGGGVPAGDTAADARYARAFDALMELLGEVVQDSLGAIRDRLLHEGARAPREVYEIYAEEIEARYLAAAASERFARVVGELLDARVEVLAALRARAP